MKKKFYFLSASIVLISNIFFLIPESLHASTDSKSIRGGVKGTQWGNPTCHCPDDAQSCFCFISD